MAKKRKSEAGEKPRARVGTSRGDDGATPSVPTWLPVALFAGLTLVLFRGFVFSDQMLVGNDTLGLGYVARAFYADVLKNLGTFPRWAPDILGGTPFLEALSGGDSFYPPSLILLLITETYRALGWKLVLHVLAAGCFMFGWVRTLGASRAAALLAGTAYLVAPFLVSLVHPGHDGKIFVTALAPLLFMAVERFFARGKLAAWAGIGLVVALVLLTTHFQMAYFLFGAVGMYAIFRSVQLALGGGGDGTTAGGPRRGLTRFGAFLAASVVGLGAAGVQFLPAADYITQYSRRIQTTREAAGETGRAWSSSWSLHPEEAMSQLIPEFAGTAAGGSAWTTGTEWGRNFFKDNHEYIGLVVLLLAAVSFLGAARPGVRWFFTGLGGVAFLFALGAHTPVWGLFYALVPGIRLFRAPSQVIFLFGFAAITLAALGMDHLLRAVRENDDAAWRNIERVLWSGAGLTVLLALLASSGTLTSIWTSVVYPEAAGDPRLQTLVPYIARGAGIAAVLALAMSGLVWAVRRAYLPAAALVAGLVALAAIDGIRVDGSFVQVMDFDRWATPDENIEAIQRLEQGSDEPFRLLSLARAGQDVSPAMHGIELAAGHHPNDLSRYRELIGMVGSGLPENLLDGDIRRLLNVRYILWPDIEFGSPQGGQIVSQTRLADGRDYQTVIAEPGLPRARLLADVVVRSDAEAVTYMLSDAFDPEAEVVLPEPPPAPLAGGPVSGSVRWEERTPNGLRLSVVSDRDALLVVADNWFPAWRATVDGTAAPVLRAYHTLRAVPVPSGEHVVEMSYHSQVVARSLWVSVVSLVVLFAAAGLGWVRTRRKTP
ncbi:MAG: hypothetical protein P8170_12030 [Gemmatimonadota bacterium]